MKILTFSREMIEKFYVPLGKSNNIQCQRRLLKNKDLTGVLNENNLSALDNYAKTKNATLYFDDLQNDLFNDVGVHVYKSGVEGKKSFAFNLDNAKEDFADCMRNLYKNVEKAINDLKG